MSTSSLVIDLACCVASRHFCQQPYWFGLFEVVDTEGWCANNLGLGPEYPGLQYESELERMSHPGMSFQVENSLVSVAIIS
jgi:hypothetical protein